MNILDIAIAKQLAGGGGSGTDNYNELSNLPKINGSTLSGDKSSSSLGLQSEIKEGAELASDLVDDTGQDNKFVTSAEKLEWSGKQNLIDSSHKLSSDLVDDTNKTNKFVTSTEKNTWNAKQNAIDADHKLSSDLVDDTNKTNKFVTSTEKNTWNAKQNAIDSEHKLSSSLVSFSEAETAALASGIDSTKVGQISTNQTNILSVEDMVCATEFSSSTAYAVGDMVTYEHKLYKFINAHQGAWSASDVQNYDLTRLEAEDRASLAEVVDSGAKNLLKRTATGSSWTSDNVTFTLNSDGSITINSSGAITANKSFDYFTGKLSDLVSAGTYVLFANASPNSRAEMWWYFTDDWNEICETTSNDHCIISASDLNRPVVVRIRALAGNAISNVKVYPMICTKAAFGVSQKFVPYRPSWDVIADSIKTVQIATSDFITGNTNFTILSQSTLFKHGSQVFGTLVIQKTDTAKFSDSSVTVGTIKSGYRPIVNLIGQSYYNTDQWGVNGFGYSYINTSGVVNVKASSDSSGTYSYVAIPINYMTA